MKTQATPTKKQTTKKARSKRPKEDYCTFVVEVIDWELTYLFSINHDLKYRPTPYEEYLHLDIKGILREPKQFDNKGIDVTFMGDRNMIPYINNPDADIKPRSLGSVKIRGEHRQFIGSLPHDSLPLIAPMLESKRIRFFHLHGSSLHRCTASINSIHFFKDFDPEEW